ncbi:NagC family transcriptional regulator [Bombiscardovia nodaiensis]|uniref:NagC family transcriptional regulator n=1 Tax=Bombiscardovia nodaiensis TaxID=2932181 RepID=A0ABN6S7M5_9BIFI|nr:NagC family transcriptional regulator [Bombiscardovia nodaiensis]
MEAQQGAPASERAQGADRGPAVDGLKLGIDIGGTKIEGIALDSQGRIVAQTRRPTHPGSQAVLADLISTARELQAQTSSQGAPPVSSLGVGIPGRVNNATGEVWDAVNLRLRHANLGRALKTELQIPVSIENDVNAAALGAYAGSDQPLMVFINLGTGLAAGVVRQGRIDHGYSGVIGEIGHIPADSHGFACRCGQHGCLETVTSGWALARLWPQASPPLPDLIRQAQQGQDQAGQVLSMFIHGLATAIQMTALSIDPATIVLGGGVTKAGPALLQLAQEELDRRAASSHFIDSLKLSQRLSMVPPDKLIGAIGAALAGEQRASAQAMQGVPEEPKTPENLRKCPHHQPGSRKGLPTNKE